MRHAQGRAGECHIVARTARQDKVRELQRTLYRAAKADPNRRFHALYDKVLRRDVLERAWGLVRVNRGAAGIDRQTIADVGCVDEPLGHSTSRSSLAGPHDRRCSTPATVCVSSRPGSGCAGRSSKSSRTSTGSCEAGRVTSATATRLSSSTTSSDTRNGVYSCGSQPAINSRGTTAEQHSALGLTAMDWSASTEPSPRLVLTGRGVRDPNAGGEERR
jgi:hypothetical protein